MKTKTILLVEDNPDDEELTLRAFKKVHVANSIHVVRDGVEALDFLFARGKYSDRKDLPLPQIVLLDLKLPKLDGLAVLKEIRKNLGTRALPVVMLTSSREEQDILQSYDLGANSFVCKPVDMNEFFNAIQQLGLYWLILNEA